MDGYGSRFLEETFQVPVSALHYWDRTGLLKPSLRPAAGRGSKRLYSFRDLVQILVVARLRDMGISLQRIRNCLDYLRKHFPDLDTPLAELSLVTDGDSVFLLTDDPQRLLDTLREQVVWSVPISSLIKSARGEIERATARHTERIVVDGQEFTVVIEQDPEDGWWIGLVEELPGCGSQGGTLPELREMVADAIRQYLTVREALDRDAEASKANTVAI